MICRLCLDSIKEENGVDLFTTNDIIFKSQILKMITKFLCIEISADDTISPIICKSCCQHLEDFYNFRQFVEQKQTTLEKNFLAVTCDNLQWTSSPLDGELQFATEIGEIDEKSLDLNITDLSSITVVQDDNVFINIPANQQNLIVEEFSEEQFTTEIANSDVDQFTTDDETPLFILKSNQKCKQKSPNKITPIMGSRTAIQLNSVPPEEHVLDEHSDNEIMIANFMPSNCELCDFKTKYFSDLCIHFEEMHNEHEPYLRCCDKIFTNPSRLKLHVRKHMNPDMFKCTICDKSLSSPDYLKTHMETIHFNQCVDGEISMIPCPKCEKTFSSEKRLTNHLNKHDTDQLWYNCEFCDKNFANSHRLRRHIQSIHEDLHPHVCDICGRKFKCKSSFERHLLEHQGVFGKPQQCRLCKAWSKNKHCLRLHMFTHDNKNTECPHCGKKCVSRTARRAHIEYAHKLQQNLQCTYCNKIFKQQRNLEEHIAIHTGLQLYNCPHCPKECRSRSNMYVHIKKRHTEEWLKAKMARSNNPDHKDSN